MLGKFQKDLIRWDQEGDLFTVDKQIGLFNGPMEGVAGGVERVGWGGGGKEGY